MNKYCDAFKLPLKTISKKPLHFVCWLLMIFILGLLPFWFGLIKGISEYNSFCYISQYLHNKSLVAFSILILANGLATSYLATKSGMTDLTAGVRGNVAVVGLILMLVNASTLSFKPEYEFLHRINVFQIILFVISSVFAAYLYCFRESDWEEPAIKIVEQENAVVEDLTKDVATVSQDKSGISV